MTKNLTVERRGSVLHVKLNRAGRHNALNDELLGEITELFRDDATQLDTRVVVLSGEGPSFSSGADVKNPPGRAPDGASPTKERWAAQAGLRAMRAVAECEAVTVARLHGNVIGGGVMLAVACDFRIGTVDANFRIPEVDLGVALAWGGTARLIEEIGAARSRELLLMCDNFDGKVAAELGVLHRAVPLSELDRTVDAWVERLASKPELAVNLTKRQFRAYSRRSQLGELTEMDSEVHVSTVNSRQARKNFM